MVTQPLVHTGENLRLELGVRFAPWQLSGEYGRDTIHFTLDEASAAIHSHVLQGDQHETEDLGE
jgi:hypothetical protein